MARLIISALATGETTFTPQTVQLMLSVVNAATGEPILDISASDIEIWDTTEKAHIQDFHGYKSGFYTMFAAWPERSVVGTVRVYGLLVKVSRLLPTTVSDGTDELWDYGQVIVPLSIMPAK